MAVFTNTVLLLLDVKLLVYGKKRQKLLSLFAYNVQLYIQRL